MPTHSFWSGISNRKYYHDCTAKDNSNNTAKSSFVVVVKNKEVVSTRSNGLILAIILIIIAGAIAAAFLFIDEVVRKNIPFEGGMSLGELNRNYHFYAFPNRQRPHLWKVVDK